MGIAASGAVLAPLIAALVAFVSPRAAASVSLLGALGVVGCAVALLAALPEFGAQLVALGGWSAPLGIQWRIDGLAVLLLALSGGLGVAVGAYANAYFAPRSVAAQYFWPLSMLLLAGLNALFLTSDLFNLYVTLELIGLSAVALVTLTGDQRADEAAYRYLLVSLLGSLLYLAGVALLYRTYGTLDMLALGLLTRGDTPTVAAIALMFTGLLLKAAIFPLHFWLAPAHSIAPAPVSALLSALVVKGALVALLRLWQDVVPQMPSEAFGSLLGTAGAVATLWGSICALRAARLKLLVAYSTVAQLGYVMLYMALSDGARAVDAWAGAVYLLLAHGVAKAAMFLAAGNLQRAAAHDDLSRLGPAAAALPLTMFAFALGGVSIMGLPPSGGFVAKWLLLDAALDSGEWLLVAALLVGSVLAAGYVFRVVQLAFPSDAGALTAPIDRPPAAMQWAPLVLATAAIALGLSAPPILETLGIALAPSGAGAAVILP